jgi:hypothetical protein
MGGVSDEFSAYGILMDVVYLLPEFPGGKSIAVIAATGLPETDGKRSVGRAGAHAFQKSGSVAKKEITRVPGDGDFYGLEDARYVVLFLPGVNQQVGVFRHENVGDEAEIVLGAGVANRLGEPLTGALFREEGLAAKTGEREEMGVAGGVVTMTALAVG